MSTDLKTVCWTSAARIGSELAKRTPIRLGGGSSTNGTPAPRVMPSQMIRIQAPKITGMTSLQQPSADPVDRTACEDSRLTHSQASSQAAASEQEVRRERRALEAVDAADESARPRSARRRTGSPLLASDGHRSHRCERGDQQRPEDETSRAEYG